MSAIPDVALSVRQPWAWALIYAGKDMENRSPGALRHMALNRQPRFAIHAAKGMTREEYEDAVAFMRSIGVACPPARDLSRGGIIGCVRFSGVVSASCSPWFFGPKAIAVADPIPRDFVPAVGALGLFKWKPADATILPTPAKWMLGEVS